MVVDLRAKRANRCQVVALHRHKQHASIKLLLQRWRKLGRIFIHKLYTSLMASSLAFRLPVQTKTSRTACETRASGRTDARKKFARCTRHEADRVGPQVYRKGVYKIFTLLLRCSEQQYTLGRNNSDQSTGLGGKGFGPACHWEAAGHGGMVSKRTINTNDHTFAAHT